MSVPSPANPPSSDLRRCLSFINHDVRGGLSGLTLMCEVLRRNLLKQPAGAENEADLSMLEGSIADHVHMIDRFLFAERHAAGLIAVRISEFDLMPVLRSAVGVAGAVAADREVRLVTEQGEAVRVEGDRELSQFCLGLLVRVAVGRAEQGSTVQVRMNAQADPVEIQFLFRSGAAGTGGDPSELHQAHAAAGYLRGMVYEEGGLLSLKLMKSGGGTGRPVTPA